MELGTWLTGVVREGPALAALVRENIYPTTFLIKAFGLSEDAAERLPRYLAVFTCVYLLCGVVTLLLRWKKGQRSLNSWATQASDVILTVACLFFVPALALMVKTGVQKVRTEVAPLQGDYLRFAGDVWVCLFDVILVCAVLLFTIYMPVYTALRYLRVYKLRGLPHMVFDVGLGYYCVSVVLLAAAQENRLFWLLIPLAVAGLCAVQAGGYIPDARNIPRSEKPAEPARNDSQTSADPSTNIKKGGAT